MIDFSPDPFVGQVDAPVGFAGFLASDLVVRPVFLLTLDAAVEDDEAALTSTNRNRFDGMFIFQKGTKTLYCKW